MYMLRLTWQNCPTWSTLETTGVQVWENENHFLKLNKITRQTAHMGKNKIERTNSMYKFRTGWEKDHERWEEVDAEEQCENCGEINRHCQCSETEDEEPVTVKSFQEKYGFDERDGPPEEEEDQP